MKNIVIVEDEQEALERIKGYLERFSSEIGEEFKIVVYKNAIDFLEKYQPDYDIVFMDIKLPNMNGMEAAKKLREKDRFVALVFVTNMKQFAVKGYEVDALDFIVKPVKYPDFVMKLQRVLSRLDEKRDMKLPVVNEDGIACVAASSIRYIEVMQHTLVYHLESEDISVYGSLKKVEQMLPTRSFIRCNSCYLINLRYVTAIKGLTLYLGDVQLKISSSKRKELRHALNNYLGGGF